MRTLLRWLACFAFATTLWLSTLHLWFERAPRPVAQSLADRQLALWQQGAGEQLAANIRTLRGTNPEWDLMARMFTVLAFANLALEQPAHRDRYLAAIDVIIDETEHEANTYGPHHFLLSYSRRQPWVDRANRSVFVDGELALMMAVRDAIAPDATHRARTRVWVDRVVAQIERAPALLAESYPDEIWVFCNTVALAAIRIHDSNEGTPERHRDLFTRWLRSAREHVVDPKTGLLASKAGYDGAMREGPEGSTIWLAATMLRLIDDDFARDQYRRARSELAGSFAGFAWAREWPASWPNQDDVDSGPTVPLVGANAGASGLALLGAAAFGDHAFVRGLVASLHLAGFPVDGGAHFAAGNGAADAVILCALASGPLWRRLGVGP